MNKIYQKSLPGVINAKSKPSFRHAETLRTAVSASNKKGFTLIELLVVVLIIGILASVALPQYQVAVGKARVARALPLLRAWALAKQHYYLANSVYSDDVDVLDIDIPYESKEVREGASTIYRGTPIGNVNVATTGDGVFWDGPGLVIDTFANGQLCYSTSSNTNRAGERICASLGRLQDGRVSASGTHVYVIF